MQGCRDGVIKLVRVEWGMMGHPAAAAVWELGEAVKLLRQSQSQSQSQSLISLRGGFEDLQVPLVVPCAINKTP